MASLLHVAITSPSVRILLFAESHYRRITSWFGLPFGIVDARCALVQLFIFFWSHNLAHMFFFAPYTMLMSITDILCDIRWLWSHLPVWIWLGLQDYVWLFYLTVMSRQLRKLPYSDVRSLMVRKEFIAKNLEKGWVPMAVDHCSYTSQ